MKHKLTLNLQKLGLFFLNIVLDQTWKSFDTKFWPNRGDCKSYCQERQNLAFFCNLVALNLEWNCVKCLIVIKFVKKFMFKRLEAKNFFWRQPWTKYFRKTLVFMWNSALSNKFNFYFSAVFCWYPQMFLSGRKTGNYLIIMTVSNLTVYF